MGRAGSAEAGSDRGRGDADLVEHVVFAVPAAHAGGDPRARAVRLGRAEGLLSSQDGAGHLDRHHEPDRAAGRLGPRLGANARRSRGRPLPHFRAEDLHHLRRARPCREHRAPGARAHPGRARGNQGHLAFPGAEVPAEARRLAGRAQQRALRVARAQARHPRQPDGGDGVRERGRLPGRRGEQGPRLHVRDDERGALQRRAGGRGDRGTRLPAAAAAPCRSSAIPTCGAC